ncbi:MAG: hypothetical protein WCY19_05880 [Candidatus Gastranaerophilaceae bacterium]
MRSEEKSFFIKAFLAILICQIFSYNPSFAQRAKVSTPEGEYKYQRKVLKTLEIEKYKRSLLPQSGFMTTEEYENLSKDVTNADRVVPEYKAPKDIKMKYIPQPTYKLVRYNDPPGSAELLLQRRFKFDRQVNGGAITSPNKDILVYPVVYYYVCNQCTAGDLFVIPLDKTLSDVDRISRANVVKKIPEPILSTPKEISEKFTFRTMTPIDFSPDGSKLVAKEKIGNVNDGIWKTNLWVYDFNTKQAKNLFEVRDAIRYYWKNQEGLVLDEKRWDITPLGFDANDPERIVVSAYGYTGKAPKFLGNWSVDYKGERTMLLSLFDAKAEVSVNGFKLVQSGVVEPKVVRSEEKKQDKVIKKDKKAVKHEKKLDKKQKKQTLKKNLKEIKKEEVTAVKQYKKHINATGPTGLN